jgi:hypothetical protein
VNSILWRHFARTLVRFVSHPVKAGLRSMNMNKNGTRRGRVGAILLTAVFLIFASVSGMAASVDRERNSLCGGCEIQVGMGGTYLSFESTGGEVIPLTLTWMEGRWEVGLFHFGEQAASEDAVERLVARPYWGMSVSRRFKFYERGPLRALFGFGLSYRTETDALTATHWNFASQLGLQYQLADFPATFELSARHWSNGGVRKPNLGQDFTVLMIRFDH